MTDTIAADPRQANGSAGAAAMARLADRLAAVTPPPAAADLARPSPAVAAALRTSAALAARADRRARRSRSITATLVDGFVAACSFFPYALAALAMRLALARVFFLDGQSKFDGPNWLLSLHGLDFSFVLPLQIKTDTLATFLTQFAALPVPPLLAAYLVSYAEIVLPLMLVIGFGTRIAALGLLAVTVLLQLYVMPQALWSAHIYWASMLLVLLSLGPGQLSVDFFIRLAADD